MFIPAKKMKKVDWQPKGEVINGHSEKCNAQDANMFNSHHCSSKLENQGPIHTQKRLLFRNSLLAAYNEDPTNDNLKRYHAFMQCRRSFSCIKMLPRYSFRDEGILNC